MAALLEVAVVTPQWAEALVKGGIASVAELRRLDLTTLGKLFGDAKAGRLIPEVPTPEQMAKMLADANALDYAGAITGTVQDRDGNPVKGASVTVGAGAELTDERGRFRLTRLLLGRRVVLRISAQGSTTRTVRLTPLPTSMVRALRFTLSPEVAVRPRRSGPTSANLSELNGAMMPALVGRNVRSGEVARGSLKNGDLLRLTAFYSNGRDVKLVSKLLEHDGVRHAVHWLRVTKDDLPPGAALGDHFLKVGTTFRRVKMSPRKQAEYKKLLRTRRGLPRAPATTPEARYQRAAETLVRMSRGES
jgi:hypothetical protein